MLVPMYKKKLDLEELKLPQSKLILILHSLSIAPLQMISKVNNNFLVCVRGGTLIRIKDGTMILKPLFRDYLLKLAEENQIAYQYYISPGGTDGGEIHKENEGIPTAVIGVCARYIHSTDAVFDIRDYFSARHLLKESIIHLTSGQIQQLQYGKEF